jgi:hypothetical protein
VQSAVAGCVHDDGAVVLDLQYGSGIAVGTGAPDGLVAGCSEHQVAVVLHKQHRSRVAGAVGVAQHLIVDAVLDQVPVVLHGEPVQAVLGHDGPARNHVVAGVQLVGQAGSVTVPGSGTIEHQASAGQVTQDGAHRDQRPTDHRPATVTLTTDH